MEKPPEAQRNTTVVQVRQFDEFTRDEGFLADPEVERQIEEMKAEPGFAQRFADTVMDAIKPEDNPADPANVIGRSIMSSRRRQVAVASDKRLVEPGKITQLKSRTRKS